MVHVVITGFKIKSDEAIEVNSAFADYPIRSADLRRPQQCLYGSITPLHGACKGLKLQ